MKKGSLLIIFLFANVIIVFACFWDKDTLAMERKDFPNTIELISGKFLRHSKEFHQWRIKDRTLKLESDPSNLGNWDDLAVSYSKVGNNEKAIELMLTSLLQKKTRRYETEANLGTFYIHKGEYKEGLKHIKNAIEINPNAHFGREVYQQFVVEYVLANKGDGTVQFPLNELNANNRYGRPYKRQGFYAFLTRKLYGLNKVDKEDYSRHDLSKEELQKAIKGVLGMMKFGDYDSPVLLEVLGDLLARNGDYEAARRLGARAYLKAGQGFEDTTITKQYKRKAEMLLLEQSDENYSNRRILQGIESKLAQELEIGEQFFNSVRRDEIDWIEKGLNPEELFAEKYYYEPRMENVKFKKINKNISKPKELKLIDKSIEKKSKVQASDQGSIDLGGYGGMIAALIGLLLAGSIYFIVNKSSSR